MISPEAHRELELQLGKSGMVASSFHLIAFLLVVSLTTISSSMPGMSLAAGTLLVGTLSARIFLFWQRKFEKWKYKLAWLTAFRISTLFVVGTWAVLTFCAIRVLGLSEPTHFIFLCLFGTGAAAALSLAMDGFATRIAILVLFIPPIVGMFLYIPSAEAWRYSLMFAMFAAFCLTIVHRVNTGYWDSVRHRESTRRQRDQLHAVLEAIPGSVGWLDGTGRYIGANRHFAGLFNLLPEDFIGRKAGSISGGSEYGDAIQTFIKSGEAQELREVQIPIQGVKRWFLMALKKYGDDANPHYLIVALDIENQKQVENELESTKAKSIESSRLAALGVMASGIAHEINNPLAILRGRLDQLVETLGEPSIDVPHAVELVRKGEKVIDRIARIVRGLQMLSRDTSTMDFEGVALSSIFEDLTELSATRFRTAGVRLEIQMPPPELIIHCRATQIGQVVLNLMNNSFDAVETLEDRWVQVQAVDRGDVVDIRVSDSGPGIPEEVATKMFDPFFTTKAVGKGTGLGLSTSRSIAEAHEGSLDLDCEASHTCFVLTLPKAPSRVRARALPA